MVVSLDADEGSHDTLNDLVDDLEPRLTAARALLLDEITAVRLAELEAANIPADIDTLLTRLSAARAALLDQITAVRLAELDAANLPADVDTLLSRLSAARALLLDELTAVRLAELDAANLPADIDTLKTRIPGTVEAQTGDSFARIGAPAGASASADIAAVKVDTAAVLVDTNELQTDWVNGGRLDLLLDAVKAKTDTIPTNPASATKTGPTTFSITTTNDTATEDLLFEVTGITGPTHVIADIDLSAAAQSKTIRFYTKSNGTDYQVVDPKTLWTTADDDGIHIDIWVQDDYKATTLNTSVAEAVTVDGQHSRIVV